MAAFNTPLTLAAIRGYLRNYALERSGDTGLITDAEANDIVNAAARLIWNRIAVRYPETFAQRSSANITVAAGAGVSYGVVSSSNAGKNIYKMLNVYVGAVGAQESAMKHLPAFDRARERWLYEPAVAAPTLPSRWYDEGSVVYFTPFPSGSFDARFCWIEMPADMITDTDTLWGGGSPASFFGDAVAILATKLALAKDRQGQTGFIQSGFDEIFKYIDGVLQEMYGPAQQKSPIDPRGT